MTAAKKLKLSITLSADLVALIDDDAIRVAGGRSGVIEQWLRRAVAADAERDLDDATAAYYASLRADALEESAAIARASSAAARRIAYDEPARRRAR